MLKNNQVWENKTKIAKLENNKDTLQAIVFRITPTGLKYEDMISSRDKDLEEFLKGAQMHLTDKVLKIE